MPNFLYLDANNTTVTNTPTGVTLTLGSINGTFNPGDVVYQQDGSNTTATVVSFSSPNLVVSGANSTFSTTDNFSAPLTNGNTSATADITAIVVPPAISNLPTFNISNTSIYNATQAITANITAVAKFGETGNISSSATRYISKNVILAEQQDAEDLVCYVTAYRPPGTDLKVYGKFLAGSDSDTFQAKDWSALVETTSTALMSSLVNKEDYVELVYDLPTSVQIVANSASVNSSSANVSVGSTDPFNAGDFIYITDNTTGKINVRQVNQIANSTSMVLASNLSFVSSNCAVGLIPGMQSQAGAFKYANNNSIARYITSADGVFDTFKVFAVKIVLVSDTYQIVPKMSDMRCLALQV